MAKTQVYDEDPIENEIQKQNTSYMIIFSGLNETKSERFIISEKLTRS